MTSPSEKPGPLLASGREADVYALDHERVLRRYRSASEHDAADEVAFMAYVASKGFAQNRDVPGPPRFRPCRVRHRGHRHGDGGLDGPKMPEAAALVRGGN